ncbi:isochorismate synthase MenF [Paenarthrobacter aurescens]|uniref:isochorismate synthase n=1 Tax=Paenarthrobacter aurescens TaxID=43663 RepID=A0A4Y3NAC6_PAEAU|nr:isochorismate synthase [Paenarthrobacter aurescens]MDO6144503.1 isochorismate synthase [Paenarthrobacter aurescens]MDO6148350.1 isochorismate synthase [Paenarthrobacter aurescens]MDO6159594.1 isochorismate synthase [Paenarthrobacter aurescens]MDO6163577.1 isochorismate synthase [Paenarthrobacter aurescens]GEB18067.1 isochorismate synthase [Paenarthrobacter aurescens]
MTSTLRTLTVPLDVESSSGGLPSFLVRDDVLCWSRREAGLVGYGELTRFNATGPERFLEADIWWRHLILEAEITDLVEVPGTGPVAFGSFAFSKTSPHVSRLILPELVIGIRDGRAWATQLTFDDAPLTQEGVLASVDRWLTEPEALGEDSTAGGPDVGLSPEVIAADGSAGHLSSGSLSEAAWMQAVSNGVEEIRAGKLEKLVLARDVVANLPEGVNAAEVLRQLAARYRECWTYGVDGLVGATPEMLIQVEGRTAQARVLAGTLDRRDADGMDGSPMEYAERVLAGSEKQRHEHEIAIDSLTRQLAPFSEAMNSHSEPFILELPNVWHLASDVKAELADIEGHVPTCLALINALHPTAAVCGTPTLVAGALIRKLEHLDRGPYAGPVGWLDAAGNGEWGIALRGAVIEDANTVRLYAGCGIVEGSVPEAELAETWAKFRPMLEALGIRR